MSKIFRKTINEVLDYTGKWENWLEGDTISTSEWEVPSGITKDSDEIIQSNTRTRIWFSGGTDNVKYKFVNLITTTEGRKGERENYITIRDVGL